MTAPEIAGIEFIEVVRVGSTAVTWKAIQRSLDRVVLVRIMNPDTSEVERENYESVARTVARIKHPNLIQVIDVARRDDGMAYAVLEAVDGMSLKELLATRQQLDQRRTVQIAMSIASALDSAWKQASLIHRNLRLEDIYLTDAGTVKITEFSAATVIMPGTNPLAHDGGLIVGTPAYMAPEQVRGDHDIDFRADIYGLGAVLYHLLTGVAPFAFEDDPARVMEMQISGTLPSPRVANNQVSAAMDTVIARCMMKDPNDRYAWWQDVLADLERISLRKSVEPLVRDARGLPQSTLAPYMAAAVAGAAPRAAAVGSGAKAGKSAQERVEARESVSKTPDGGPDSGTRFLLWVMLLAVVAVAAVYRWNNSDVLPPEQTQEIRRQPTAPLYGVRETNRQETSPTTAPSVQTPAPIISPPQTAPTVKPAPTAEPARPATPEPEINTTAPISGPDMIPSLVASVTDALIGEDYEAAAGLLRAAAGRTGGESARAAALKLLENPLSIDDVVGIHLLENYRGKVTRIRFQNRDVSIVPDSYAAGYAKVELVGADGSRRPWSMKISSLAPSDRLRFLGTPEPTSQPDAERDMAIALLAMAARDKYVMRRMTERVAPLAPFLNEAASR